MSNAEKLAALLTTFVVSLALSLLVNPPWNWALLSVTVVLVCIGADQIVHANWLAHSRRHRYSVTAWTLPAMATVTAFLFLRLPVFYSGIGMGLGLAAAGALLCVIIVAQCRSLDASNPWHRYYQVSLRLLVYLIGLGLYSAIYAPKVRSLLSATAVVVVSALLAMEVLKSDDSSSRRIPIYAGVVGLVLGQITWALNYWTIDPLAGGAILLLAFYLVTGIAQNYLSGELTRRVFVEFGVVSGVGLCVVLYSLAFT